MTRFALCLLLCLQLALQPALASAGLAGSTSASVGVNFAAQDGEYERLETFHTNTEIAVGGNLDLTSGRDTTLAGAVINAGSATVDVGRDLTIISQVDTVEGSNDSRGFNAGLSVGLGTGGAIGVSVGANGATGDESRVWVADPSGITTDGALDVDVVRGTAITGGVIASLSGDLTLDTETLETADIALKDDQSSASGSLGVNIGANSQGVSKPGITVEGAYSNSEVDGVAKATIGEGEITVRSQSDEETDEQLANLNRDPNDVVEITNTKDEGFELYLSDTAVRELKEGLPKVRNAINAAVDKLRDVFGDDYVVISESEHALDGFALVAQKLHEDCRAAGGSSSYCNAVVRDFGRDVIEGLGDASAATGDLLLDLIPIIGDAKGLAECVAAPSAATCGGAVVGIVPGVGDLAKITIKKGDDVFEVTTKGGEITNVSKGGVEATNRTFDFSTSGSGTHLTRTTSVDGTDVRINSGHAYNRTHSGGDVSQIGSMDEIETAILNDISSNSRLNGLSGTGNQHTIQVNGQTVIYELSDTPIGPVLSNYYPPNP